MKVEKKEGLNKIVIKHNKVLFWVIIVLFIVLCFVVYSLMKLQNNNPSCSVSSNNSCSISNVSECNIDSDCVPKDCCHATSCIPSSQKQVCNLLCTQDCKPNTLDCEQGSCVCQNGKCNLTFNKNGDKKSSFN